VPSPSPTVLPTTRGQDIARAKFNWTSVVDKDAKPNFWTTLPGVLTGIAALLTAVASVVVAFHQFGTASDPVNAHSNAPSDLPGSAVSPPTASPPKRITFPQ